MKNIYTSIDFFGDFICLLTDIPNNFYIEYEKKEILLKTAEISEELYFNRRASFVIVE